MKVCLLNDSFPPVIDGVANVVMNYADILVKEKLAEVMVGTPRYPGADYEQYPYKVLPYKSFDTTKIVNGYRAGDPLDLAEIREMSEFSPDIIHSHCPAASNLLGRVLRRKTKAPLIFTYHTKFDVDIARAVQAKFIQKESIKVLVNNIQASDEVWVVSRGAGDNLRSLGYEGPYRVMNNGVDFPKGKVPEEEVSKATEGFDLPDGLPVFLFVGRLVEYKGLFLILEALKKLSDEGVDFRMLFVGAVHDREKLRAWNTRADLFLFPSTYDTNGIVVREAAACGLASVLISGSCAAEGITDRQNGFLIDENSFAMYKLLLELSYNKDKMTQVGERAMEEIYISWESSVKAAHARYEEILEEKKGALEES